MTRLTCIFVFLSFLLWFGCNSDNSTSGGRGPSITSITPSQAVRGQRDIDGRIVGTNFTGVVAVDLGDGIKIHQTSASTSTEVLVKFSVNADAAPGKRTVRIATAQGIAENSNLFSVSDNFPPIVTFTVDPPNGIRDTVFTYDASGSKDPDGKIVGYDWNFGDDQTATGLHVTHQYNAAGTFKVTLTAQDNHDAKTSLEKELTVENLMLPIARFTVTPHSGTKDTAFLFDASNSTDPDGNITSYEWDFRDGTKETGKKAKHKFPNAKNYDVKLTVTDNTHLQNVLEKEVVIRGKAPVARFDIQPQTGDTNTVFQFDASSSYDSDGTIKQYQWNFGDGKTGSGKTTTHKYASDGSFNVKLTVTDNDELQQNDTTSVKVNKPGSGAGTECTTHAPNNGFIYGTVIDVQGYWAIVQLPPGSTCANSFYYCGDMRRYEPSEQFRGIIKKMKDLGNSVFAVYNDCPYIWPPAIGESEFLYWKSCSQNYCP